MNPFAFREKYLASSWIERLFVSASIVLLAAIIAHKGQYDAALTAIGFSGLLVAAHIAVRYPTQLATALVVVGHVALVLTISTLHATMFIDQFGYGAVFIVIAVNLLASILLTVCAVRWSAGKLWLTLLLTFLCLDLLGSVVVASTNILNLLIAPALAALMLLVRCILWRNLWRRFRSRNDLDASRDKFAKFRSAAALDSLTTVLESAGANIRTAPETSGPINAIVETVDAVYYLTVIKSPAIKIFAGGMSTDGTLLDPLFVQAYLSAAKLHKGFKGLGKNREMRVMVVNANSKEGKEQTLGLKVKGGKRGTIGIITLSSPAAMLRTVKNSEAAPKKKDEKGAQETVSETPVDVAA